MTSVQEALIHKLTALADDELILAHRDSEWTGHAPILEEDIALANLAQDELGHATLWYGLREAIDGSDPDKLVYFREASGWRNAPLLEFPKGDWAFTMLRQYLFDAYEHVHLIGLGESTYTPIAEVAAKIRKEERFHLQHTYAWTLRLGLGTEESHGRLQKALGALWPYAQGLFIPLPNEDVLVEKGIVPRLDEIKEGWLELVTPHLERSNLAVPVGEPSGSRETHTEHLTQLLNDLQEVARLEPEASW